MSEKITTSTPFLMVVGALLVVGSVSIVTNSGFKITVQKPLSEAASAIRLISPNGGQTYSVGSKIQITQRYCDWASFRLVEKTKQVIHTFGPTGTAVTNSDGTKTHTVTIPSTIAFGQYYILASCLDSTPQAFDYSDGLITLKSTPTTIPFVSAVRPSGEKVYLNDTWPQWTSLNVYRYNVALMKQDISSGVYRFVTQLPNNVVSDTTTTGDGGLSPLGATGVWPANQAYHFNSSGAYVNNRNGIRKYVNTADYGKSIFKIKIIGFDANGKVVSTAESKEPFQVVDETANF